MKLFSKPLELVILDVDGVILDLLANFQKTLETAASQCNLSVEPIGQYFKGVQSGKIIWKGDFRGALQYMWPSMHALKAAQLYVAFRREEQKGSYPAIPGSIEAIQWFRERNMPMALCTSNEKSVLEHRFAPVRIDLSWFVALSTSDSKFTKPHEKTLDQIFEAVDVPREHAVYVGDWYPDMEVARSGGVRFVAVLTGGIPREAFLKEGVSEDHIVERLEHIVPLVEV